MSQERLSVRKIREVLRLKNELGLSNRAIARACRVSNSTVGEYVVRARQAGLSWPLPEGLSEEELYQRLFPEKSAAAREVARPLPEWEEVQRELSRRGVTLKLLWIEYREKHPDGYGLTQYCEYYRRWRQSQAGRLRLPHKGGEEMEVDYAGMSVPITNPETGEVSQVVVFVATLPASRYVYAEIQPSQELAHWIGGHVRAFAFFGGVPKIVRPDNLKSGVKSPNYYEPELNPSYQEMAEHYHVAVLPARVRKPRDYPEVLQIPKNCKKLYRNVFRRICRKIFGIIFFCSVCSHLRPHSFRIISSSSCQTGSTLEAGSAPGLSIFSRAALIIEVSVEA